MICPSLLSKFLLNENKIQIPREILLRVFKQKLNVTSNKALINLRERLGTRSTSEASMIEGVVSLTKNERSERVPKEKVIKM